MTPRIVFESADLRATFVPGQGLALLFVTFSSFSKLETLDRPGFGEDFLRDEGVAAIHVVARVNRWFQHPELPALIAAIRAQAAGYDRVIAYGSSMGGFAALTYGAECGADAALAFSPQLSLDRRAAPWETRWRGEARQIRRWLVPGRRLALQVIAYDPHHAIDARHAAALAARAPTILLRVPHGGHPAGACLSQADLLKSLARDIAAGQPDANSYETALRGHRRRSPQYLYTVARRLGAHHGAMRLRLAEMALAFDRSPHVRTLMADALAGVGRHDEALAMHAVAAAGGDVDALAAQAGYLIDRGDPAGAWAIAERLPPSRARTGLRWRIRLARAFGFRRRLL